MRGLLPSVWLLLAGLYTASLLALLQPFSRDDDWPTPPSVNETVRAKEPWPVALQSPAEAAASPFQRVSLVAPVAPKGVERQDQWVRIGGYTTVARAEPTTAAPVLFAYTPGRPLRVIAREGGFAHVQDLGSGQYGWVKESALAPFTGGDRQREDVAPQPQVVASAAPASAPEQVAAPKAARAKMAAAARRQGRRRCHQEASATAQRSGSRAARQRDGGGSRAWSSAASSASGTTGRSASL